MGIVRNALERLGFARLKDYGLILTPDRRVLTTRTRILDDGFGGRVVGWVDGDLATMELGTWGEAPEVAASPRDVAAPPPDITASPPVVTTPPVVAAPTPALENPDEPAAPELPDEPPEDEWEWEIAMARARAAEAPPVAPAGPPPRANPFTMPERLTKGRKDTAIRPMEQSARASEQKLAVESQPNTIIPVPALPAADPQLVRSHHEAMRRQAPRPFARR